jgi:hypothetical protein
MLTNMSVRLSRTPLDIHPNRAPVSPVDFEFQIMRDIAQDSLRTFTRDIIPHHSTTEVSQ